jgi:hypothetical protein
LGSLEVEWLARGVGETILVWLNEEEAELQGEVEGVVCWG